jgi:hypothetical protein
VHRVLVVVFAVLVGKHARITIAFSQRLKIW